MIVLYFVLKKKSWNKLPKRARTWDYIFNIDTSLQNFQPPFLENDLLEQKKCTVAHEISIPLPLYFFIVLTRRFLNN